MDKQDKDDLEFLIVIFVTVFGFVIAVSLMLSK
jgi:hypothetical protein